MKKRYLKTVMIPPDRAFSDVIESIDRKLNDDVIVETVAEFWTVAIWSLILNQTIGILERSIPTGTKDSCILRKSRNKKRYFLHDINKTVYKICFKKINKEDVVEELVSEVSELIHSSINFDSAKNAFVNIMSAEKLKIAILIDNIEEVNLSSKKHSLAMNGLLKAITTFRDPSLPCDIKCCISSEIYPRLLQSSSNPDKDFSSMILVEWKNSELFNRNCSPPHGGAGRDWPWSVRRMAWRLSMARRLAVSRTERMSA